VVHERVGGYPVARRMERGGYLIADTSWVWRCGDQAEAIYLPTDWAVTMWCRRDVESRGPPHT
jgi:hypothetical protein